MTTILGDTDTLTENERVFFDDIAASNPPKAIHPSDALLQQLSGVTSNTVCPHCHGKDVSYRTVQARSMDEGMSICFHCNSCNKEWKTK